MAEIPLPGQDSIEAQREMFRRAERECGLSVQIIANRSPLNISTLKGWRNGAAMPAWALGALHTAGVPDHLLTLVLEPFRIHVISDEDGESCLDTAALDAGEVQQAVQRARHPNSPGGTAIVPQERAEIMPLVQKAAASARKAARKAKS